MECVPDREGGLAEPIDEALQLLSRFVALLDPSQLNNLRFENCRRKVLDLPLGKSDIKRLQSFLDKAERYLRHGALGAGKFELNLATKLLRQKLNSCYEP